jgi:prevent-host-death family protein
MVMRRRLALSAQVSVAQAKARFAAFVARAEAGETIVVTRNGRPVACLGPLPDNRPIKYGDLRSIFLAEDLSLPADVVGDFEPVV